MEAILLRLQVHDLHLFPSTCKQASDDTCTHARELAITSPSELATHPFSASLLWSILLPACHLPHALHFPRARSFHCNAHHQPSSEPSPPLSPPPPPLTCGTASCRAPSCSASAHDRRPTGKPLALFAPASASPPPLSPPPLSSAAEVPHCCHSGHACHRCCCPAAPQSCATRLKMGGEREREREGEWERRRMGQRKGGGEGGGSQCLSRHSCIHAVLHARTYMDMAHQHRTQQANHQ